MNHYFIRWEIDIWEETPRKAAEEALKTQRDPGSSATVFEVIDEAGTTTTIDLEEEEGEIIHKPLQKGAKRNAKT